MWGVEKWLRIFAKKKNGQFSFFWHFATTTRCNFKFWKVDPPYCPIMSQQLICYWLRGRKNYRTVQSFHSNLTHTGWELWWNIQLSNHITATYLLLVVRSEELQECPIMSLQAILINLYVQSQHTAWLWCTINQHSESC